MTHFNFCELVAVEPIGEGTRVCLDLVDCLDPEEGVLLGDTGHGYLLVLSEKSKVDRPTRLVPSALIVVLSIITFWVKTKQPTT